MATPIPVNSARFTLDEVAVATAGALRVAGAPTRGVTTDSRCVGDRSLFVALVGEQHDGHDYLPQVAAAGAGAVVVKRGAEVPEGVGVVEVDDTLRALGDLARFHRERWGGRVVGITGSAGKTSTKELMAGALRGAGVAVEATRGNLNNRIGVPMTLFTLDEAAEVAVVEMGTSERGEIARLAEIARPDVGVLTLVAAAHTEGLGSVDAVANEKGALLEAVGAEGAIVANGDDPRVRRVAERAEATRRWLFGESGDCDIRLVDWTMKGLRTHCTFAVKGEAAPVVLDLGLLGEAAANNTAAVLGVLLALGVDREGALGALLEAMPHEGRMRPVEGKGGVLILDDTYNANPRSTEFALHTAAQIAESRGGRLFAALGDMKELGGVSETEHRQIGGAAIGIGAFLVATGPEMKAAADAAAELDAEHAWVSGAAEASSFLDGLMREGDVLLVKGSRSMAMEAVVHAFSADPRSPGGKA